MLITVNEYTGTTVNIAIGCGIQPHIVVDKFLRYVLVLLSPPRIYETGNTSSTSIYIKWQPPVSDYLYKLLGYRIFYKETNDTSLTLLVKSVEKNVREIEITDLKIYTNYSVRVSAFSSAGNGIPTVAHHIITDESSKCVLSIGLIKGCCFPHPKGLKGYYIFPLSSSLFPVFLSPFVPHFSSHRTEEMVVLSLLRSSTQLEHNSFSY